MRFKVPPTDRRRGERHRAAGGRRQIKREVMDVALVHGFDAEAAAVEHIGPGVDHPALVIHHRVVEVEAVQVEGEAGHRQGGEPDAHHREGPPSPSQLSPVQSSFLAMTTTSSTWTGSAC